MEKANQRVVVPLRPNSVQLASDFSEVANEDHRIFLGSDVRSKLFEIGVSRLELVRMLRDCEIHSGTLFCDQPGSWLFQVSGKLVGLRSVVQVSIRFDGSNIFVTNVSGNVEHEF